MSVEQPIISDLKSEHRKAVNAVNHWRGRCVDCFARIEQASVIALEALTAGKNNDDKIPATFGLRIEKLKSALTGEAPARQSKACLDALAAIEKALKLRNAIVHATGQVWIDSNGHWLWTYRYVSNDKGRTEVSGKIDCDEAAVLERLLASKGRSLGDHLANLAKPRK